MRRTLLLALSLTVLAGCQRQPAEEPAPEAAAPPSPAGGDQTIAADADLVTNAARQAELTTFVSAIQTAGLAETLRQPGPFTVFAPGNPAFDAVPAEERERLASSAGADELRRLLTYHVVPGRLTVSDLLARAQEAGGQVQLTTVVGQPLTVSDRAGRVVLTDGGGLEAQLTRPDGVSGNGVIHVTDRVLQPG
jgi:uncharacterized surface protein with fasciclin (FAS1) repeats